MTLPTPCADEGPRKADGGVAATDRPPNGGGGAADDVTA